VAENGVPSTVTVTVVVGGHWLRLTASRVRDALIDGTRNSAVV
jgi:hypothetical protein